MVKIHQELRRGKLGGVGGSPTIWGNNVMVAYKARESRRKSTKCVKCPF